MNSKLYTFLIKLLPNITITDTEGKPYLTRFFPFGKERGILNIFLHYFHQSDKDRSLENGTLLLHNHPWLWSLSLILWGGYSEERRQLDDTVSRREYRPGHFNYLNDKHFHRVDLLKDGGWSLFMTGWRRNVGSSWGFWDRETKVYTNFLEALAKLGKTVLIP
jgi:hypothetical protein